MMYNAQTERPKLETLVNRRGRCQTISPDSVSVRRLAINDSTSATCTHSSRPPTKNRTVIILNANPNADALHPDAIYRLNIDNDGDYLTDIAFSYVFSKPENGRQTVDVLLAKGL